MHIITTTFFKIVYSYHKCIFPLNNIFTYLGSARNLFVEANILLRLFPFDQAIMVWLGFELYMKSIFFCLHKQLGVTYFTIH